MQLSDTFLSHFSDIQDPRFQNHNFRHHLSDILIVAILATICGADGWAEIERFGQVFSLLNPKVFDECFTNWLNSLTIDLKREVIALDGKTVKGSSNKRQNVPALHLVNAWATFHRMRLGQVKTDDKSNEITAIPKLLEMLDISDSIVTIDAMGCQTKIAKQIRAQGADYVLTLKANQKTLYENVVSIFAQAEKNKQKQYKGILHRRKIEKVKNHGRIETRRYTLLSARNPLLFELRWPGLRGLGKVDVVRTICKVTRSTCYFLTSLEYENIDEFMKAVRKHWEIEVDLHWS